MPRTTKRKSENIVLDLVMQFPPAQRWIETYIARRPGLGDVEKHHIYGRWNREQKNWRCNLIGIYDAVHDCNHDRGKCAIELCCLYTQWSMQVDYDEKCEAEGKASQPGHKKFWNVAALGALCPYATLAGRIEVKLLPVVVRTPLEKLADELLMNLDNEYVPF